MTLLVVGANGQVGSALVRQSGTPWAYGSRALDVTSPESVRRRLGEFADAGGSVVVNASAYTAVDAAESDVDSAFAVNADGPANLMAECAAWGLTLVHLSTDYVFSGQGDRPYEVDDPTEPATVYGRSKLAGERSVVDGGGYVVRTAWVYGDESRPNFVRTMLGLAARGGAVSVVDDQWGSPTWAEDLAAGLLELVRKRPDQRVLHATGGGVATWFSFAQAVFAEGGFDPGVVSACRTEDYPRPAPRPGYSVLSGRAWEEAGLTGLGEWRGALRRAFDSGGFGRRG